ncbi:putative membrane protein [Clostridium bornimense]|uniref:Putative membrane protein n=1 Tax=Clostridium bornimense TaxID=1216932 RepID=W6S0W8_9CLOT|nr:hypothetical protein [Clostridium bornimense]CDM70383.1 putative membrane protein [Clostridium bornimense]
MNIKFKVTQQDFIKFHIDNFLSSKLFKTLLIRCYIYFFLIYITLNIIFKSTLFTIIYFGILIILYKFLSILLSKLMYKFLTKYTIKEEKQYLFETTNITLQDSSMIITTKYSTRILKLENIKEILSNKSFICIKFNTQDSILFSYDIENSGEFIDSILKVTNLQIKKISGGK